MAYKTKSIVAFIMAVIMLSGMLSLVGCGKKDDYIVKIGDYEITYEFYRYLYMNYRDELSSENYSEEELDKKAHENTMESLVTTCRVQTHADRYGVSVPDDIIQSIDNKISEMKSEYSSEEDYKKALADAYTDEKLLREIMVFAYLEDFVRQYMTAEQNGCIHSDDATVEAYIYSDFYRAVQILIKSEEEDREKELLAQSIYDRLCAGESFDSLSDEYNQDFSVDDPDDGYYFTKGQLLLEFEEAVLSIKENELYPGVVKSSVGYHIIKRLPLDPSYVDDNFNTLREIYKARKYNDICKETEKELKIEFTELYSSLTAQDYINDTVNN